jgi:hypothetical protein
MQAPLTTFLALALSAFTSACSMSTEKVDAKKNPDPKMRYEVTLTIDNAPGPFDSITGFMQYEVTNIDCVPETGVPWNRMRLPPQIDSEITLTRVGNNIYKGAVYGDYFQDEDYFGLGMCHWSLAAVGTHLNINKTAFITTIFRDDLFAQKSVTRYFSREIYLNKDINIPDSGRSHRTDYSPETQDGVFSVTLSTKEGIE